MLMTSILTACVLASASVSFGPEELRANAIKNLGSQDRQEVWRAIEFFEETNKDDQQALLAALTDADRQRRQFAMILLCEMDVAPSPALLDACYEGLRDDDIPLNLAKPPNQRILTNKGNANEAANYLAKHAKDAGKLIERGMREGDWQQKLLCAFVAGRAGREDLIPLAAPILIKHLADNDQAGDADTAIAGLVGFGKSIRPHLTIQNPDAQQRQIAKVLTRWIDDPSEERLGPWLKSLSEREREELEPYALCVTHTEARLSFSMDDLTKVMKRDATTLNSPDTAPREEPKPEKDSKNDNRGAKRPG